MLNKSNELNQNFRIIAQNRNGSFCLKRRIQKIFHANFNNSLFKQLFDSFYSPQESLIIILFYVIRNYMQKAAIKNIYD